MSALGAGMDCAIARSWESGQLTVVSLDPSRVVLIVPDVSVVEAVANGHDLPRGESVRVTHENGRTAWLYRLTPGDAADALEAWFARA